MSDFKSITGTLIYNEFSEEDRVKFFSRKDKKFISHIDTFYYVVYCDSTDWRSDSRKEKLIQCLSAAAAWAASSPDQTSVVFEDVFSGLTCHANMHFNMYSYHFSLDQAFDVFVSDYTPNKDTPPIFVQLRSNALWLRGTKNIFDESLDVITKILNKFGISVREVVENRIDYAFHTNYIQDLLHYFPERDLKEMQVSQFQRWHKEGYFFDDGIYCDYFTLGRRKSNNVFFRIYDKTKEVIEMGYKQFFIPIWYENGLISLYDKYVLEYTFHYGSWNAVHLARCHFYYEHGRDFSIRKELGQLLQDPDTPYQRYKDYADKLVPDITTVCNVEFQCKRKFFYNIHKTIPDLMLTSDYKDHIYSLIEQSKSITNHLTTNIIRFVKYKKRYSEIARHKRPDADWWVRLRSCKSFDSSESFAEYVFSYQNNLDLFRIRYNTMKSMARTSSYYASEPDDLDRSYVDDFFDFYSHMNDNDIARYYEVKHSSYRSIVSKRLKTSASAKLRSDVQFSEKRYESLYKYWLSQIYNQRLDRDKFVDVLKKIFEAVPEAQNVYINMLDYYNTRSVDSKCFSYYSILKYCFEKVVCSDEGR